MEGPGSLPVSGARVRRAREGREGEAATSGQLGYFAALRSRQSRRIGSARREAAVSQTESCSACRKSTGIAIAPPSGAGRANRTPHARGAAAARARDARSGYTRRVGRGWGVLSGSSAARQRYQQATLRYGLQPAAMRSISAGFGIPRSA